MMPVRKTQGWLPGIFNDFFGNEWVTKVNSTAPAVNIIESNKDYKVEIAAPGMTKDDFKIKITNDNQLVVMLEKKDQKEEKNNTEHERYLRREFSFSQFQQTMILPENVDKTHIQAAQENGVLTILIPKKEAMMESKAKEIAIK